MKLKTLKDINDEERKSYKDLGEDYGEWVDVEILKQEAIKCIDSNSIKHMNANDFILWFFNITEEDLK